MAHQLLQLPNHCTAFRAYSLQMKDADAWYAVVQHVGLLSSDLIANTHTHAHTHTHTRTHTQQAHARSHTSIRVHFIQCVQRGRGEHAEVGSKLLHQCLDHLNGGGRAGDADALGRHLLPVTVRTLEVEPHHPFELEGLKCTAKQ